MMTKRASKFEESNGKKPRLDEEEDWGDDIDESVLEKAFDIYESSQKENTMVAPSTYNSFKQPGAFFTASTQMSTSVSVTTKSLAQKPCSDLEAQIKKLELQNKEKDGEISILRSKIKECKTSSQVEQTKTTTEWRQKLLTAEKQLNSTKSELEFKNLELVNLKQQIGELRKQYNKELNNSQMLSQSQFAKPEPPRPLKKIEEPHCSRLGLESNSKVPQSREEIKDSNLNKTEILLNPVYPLKKRLPPDLFKRFSKEKHIWKFDTPKISRNTTPYLQNQGYKSDTLSQHHCINLSHGKIVVDEFYNDFLLLMNSSTDELETLAVTEAIKRVIVLSMIELNDLNDFLCKYENSLKTDELKQMDVNYLLEDFNRITDFNAWEFEKDQFGMRSGKFLTLLADVLPYNSYLMNCILSNGHFDWNFLYKSCERRQKKFRILDNYFLDQSLNIVSSIGKYRQASVMTEFLCSLIKILTSITKLKDSEETIQKYFNKFFREIVCARPEPKVIYQLTFFIRMTARYHSMVEFFFKNEDKLPKEVIRKSIIHYNTEGSCAFCIFHLLYQLTLLKAKNLPIIVCVNVLSFIYSTFKNFSWIHHDDRRNVCICQSQLYTVAVETIFNIMERYVNHYEKHKRNDSTLEEWETFLSHPIVVKVFNLMSFNAFDVLEKFLVVYAKFKEIQRVLKDKWQFYDAEVTTTADIPTISESKFSEIGF